MSSPNMGIAEISKVWRKEHTFFVTEPSFVYLFIIFIAPRMLLRMLPGPKKWMIS